MKSNRNNNFNDEWMEEDEFLGDENIARKVRGYNRADKQKRKKKKEKKRFLIEEEKYN